MPPIAPSFGIPSIQGMDTQMQTQSAPQPSLNLSGGPQQTPLNMSGTPPNTPKPVGPSFENPFTVPKAQAQSAPSTPTPNTTFGSGDVTKMLSQGKNYDDIFQNAMVLDPKFQKYVNYYQNQPGFNTMTTEQFHHMMVSGVYMKWKDAPTTDPNSVAIAQAAQDSAQGAQSSQGGPMSGILGYLGKTLSNVPSDTAQMIGGIAQSVMHPIQTAEGLGEAGIGIGQQIDKLLPKQMQLPQTNSPFLDKTNQIGQNIVGELGNAIQHPLQTFQNHPVQTILTLAPIVGEIGKITGLGDTVSQIPAVAKVGDFMNVVKSAPANIAKGYLGAVTGAGKGAVEEALKGSDEFIQGMRGNEVEQLKNIVSDAQDAIKQMYSDRGNTYVSQKAGLAADSNIIDPSKVQTLLQNIQSKFDIGNDQMDMLNKMKGMTDQQAEEFLNSMLKNNSDVENPLDPLTKAGISNPTSANKISKAMNIVQNWEDYTPAGLDKLHKALTGLKPMQNTVESSFINKIDNGVKDLVKQVNPDYAKMLDNYHTATKQIEQMESELSLGQNTNAATIVRKISGAMRTGNQGHAMRNAMLDDLQELSGVNIKGRVGGTAMNAWAPRGMQGVLAGNEAAIGIVATLAHLINPAFVGALLFSSPRIAGEALVKIGMAQRTAETVLNALRLKSSVIIPALGIAGETSQSIQ